MDQIKLFSNEAMVGEIDRDIFEITKLYLLEGCDFMVVVRKLCPSLGTALAVRVALNAKKSNNRSD